MAAVARGLNEPSCSAGAREVARRIAGMHAPQEVLSLLPARMP
ncbi:hypothetical protein GCM10027074_13530 [Streptomyces deserti]